MSISHKQFRVNHFIIGKQIRPLSYQCIFMEGNEKISKCPDYGPALNKPRKEASAEVLKKLMVTSIIRRKKKKGVGRDQDRVQEEDVDPGPICDFLRTTCVVEKQGH